MISKIDCNFSSLQVMYDVDLFSDGLLFLFVYLLVFGPIYLCG